MVGKSDVDSALARAAANRPKGTWTSCAVAHTRTDDIRGRKQMASSKTGGGISKRRKAAKVTIAAVLAGALAITGMFAWSNASQLWTNKLGVKVNANPGGRVHDDFIYQINPDGTVGEHDKNVYAESFSGNGTVGEDVYVRLQLREYLEYGFKLDEDGNVEGGGEATVVNQASPKYDRTNSQGVEGTSSPWSLVTLDGYKTGPFAPYRELTLSVADGGNASTKYIPTFNMNATGDENSKKVDVRGAMDNSDLGTPSGADPYAGYLDMANFEVPADGASKNPYDPASPGTGPYDGYIGTETFGGDRGDVADKTHAVAQSASTAGVITLADWNAKQAADKYANGYWVYADGWFYWSKPVPSKTATGLLVDDVLVDYNFGTNSYFYQLDVKGEFITADELTHNDKEGKAYFTAQGAETKDATKEISPTVDAFLDYAVRLSEGEPTMSFTLGADKVKQGGTTPAANLTTTGSWINDVVFSLPADAASKGVSIDAETGVITATKTAIPGDYTVTATGKYSDNDVFTVTQNVKVMNYKEALRAATKASDIESSALSDYENSIVTIGGYDCYVLDFDTITPGGERGETGTYSALVFTAEPVTETVYTDDPDMTYTAATYSGSKPDTYLETWFTPDIKNKVPGLSIVDYCLTYPDNVSASSPGPLWCEAFCPPKSMIEQLIPNPIRARSSWWWTCSNMDGLNSPVCVVGNDGAFSFESDLLESSNGVRPAFWVSLS